MARGYRQFSVEERCELSRLRGEGHSIRAIAAHLHRAPSSVARELKRNSGVQVGYQPGYAHEQAQARRWSGSRLDRNAALREQVLGWLRAGWSPEQISGRSGGAISAETIYRFIYAQIRRHNDYSWRHYLPRGKSRRGRRPKKGGSHALHMSGRVSLDKRPLEVASRTSPGHWEADLMAFSRTGQNLLMLHERMSRALMRDGPQAGLDLIAPLIEGSLADFRYAHAAVADLHRRLGQHEAALQSYQRALALTQQTPERRFIERRIAELGGLNSPVR